MTRVALLSSAHMHVTSYLRALNALAEVEVVGIYDDDEARGRSFASAHQVRWVDRLSTLLAEADATVIGSENARHRFYAEQSADAGLPMLCEKPLATTLADALAMIAAARQHDVPLFMALPVRFVPTLAQMVAAVHRGAVGRVLAMVGTNHGNMPSGWFVEQPLSGGGAIMDHTPHVADIMRWITNSEVVEVFAEMSSRVREAGIDDAGIVQMRFANGTFASLDPSWSRLGSFPTWGDVTLEVVGTQGVLDFDAFRQHLDLYAEGTPSYRHLGYGEDMDAQLIGAFVDSVSRKLAHPTLAQGSDGLKALEIALAAYQSANSHRPVKVDGFLASAVD